MASQGSRPSVARCALPRATVRAPFRSLIAVRVNAQANVWFQPSQPFIMLYSIHYLLHKVGLLEKPGPEPGDKDKGAARDRTDGPVTDHGSASTNIESVSPQNSGVKALNEKLLLAARLHMCASNVCRAARTRQPVLFRAAVCGPFHSWYRSQQPRPCKARPW